MSPTQRALAELRKLGAVASITERWNAFAKIRQDLFGFCDVLAIIGPNIVAIQVTSGTNHAARRTKILSEPRAESWLKAGGMIEVWSFAKKGKHGNRKLWSCRKEEVTLQDLRSRTVSGHGMDPVMRRVVQLFEKSGKTLEELGLAMGADPATARQTAWQFISKTGDPRISMLRRFAKAAGVSLEELIGEKKR